MASAATTTPTPSASASADGSATGGFGKHGGHRGDRGQIAAELGTKLGVEEAKVTEALQAFREANKPTTPPAEGTKPEAGDARSCRLAYCTTPHEKVKDPPGVTRGILRICNAFSHSAIDIRAAYISKTIHAGRFKQFYSASGGGGEWGYETSDNVDGGRRERPSCHRLP
jgi:hypothetical protein